jgi:hypothetical protein
MKVFDFLCEDCRTLHEEWVENSARYGDAGGPCPMCDGATEAVPVPPKARVATAAPSFERGSGPERPGPGTFDTRAIADRKIGEPQWKEQRSKMWRDRERAQALGHRDKIRVR